MTMFIERKQDLSVYYYIENLFTTYPDITVVDEFPTTTLTIPTVAVENGMYTVEWYELGNRRGIDLRTWFIDVYAKNKSQRDDYSYLIKNEVQDGIPVYDYDEGFPPDVSPTQIGAMEILELSVEPIPILAELVSTLYYRAQVRLIARYVEPLN